MDGADDIIKALPHRYPFLLVDRILEHDLGKRIVGLKNVTINEPFFQGHFPGHPVMPGVLIVECMAQVGGLMMLATGGDPSENQLIMYFTSLDNVKWRKPVRPGRPAAHRGRHGSAARTHVQDPRRRARGWRDRVRSGHGRDGPRPMSVRIHPTALVSPDAQIGENVEIGAFAIVGPECVIGDGCVIAPRATLETLATLAANVNVGSGSIIGGDPAGSEVSRASARTSRSAKGP